MARTLELPDTVFSALQAVAAAQGTTPAEWIAAILPSPNVRSDEPKQGTMLDRLQGYIGTVSGPTSEPFSEQASQRFADDVERRYREGRL